MSLFAHDMTLYLGNATTLPGNYWSSSMNSGYKKVSGYKIYIQKSVAFSYPNSKILEREIKEIIPFTIASKRIKSRIMNLPKEAKDLYSENYKMLMKEIEVNTCNIERYTKFLDWKNQYC